MRCDAARRESKHVMTDIAIRPLSSMAEFLQAVRLQADYWGDDLEAVVPAHMLDSLVAYGGHVLAAFDGTRMVGVLIGFLGTNTEDSHRPAMANLLIASKRMVVLPEYRSHGIGAMLKWAQRDMAMKQGVRLITWTFDPVLSLNAYLNVHKLGVVCAKFIEDRYGTDGYYATLGSSDRLVADWWVTSRRVVERAKGTRGDLALQQYLDANTAIVNPTVLNAQGNPVPQIGNTSLTTSLALFEIPGDFNRLVTEDVELARHWRMHVREIFRWLLTTGYIVTDVLYETYEGRKRAFYVLSRDPGSDFSLN